WQAFCSNVGGGGAMPNQRSDFKAWVIGAAITIALIGSARLHAETSGTSTAYVAAPSESKTIAGIDLRPSWDPSTGVVRSEDSIEVGYQFNKTTKLTYVQAFNTHIATPDSDQRFGTKLDAGFIRTSLSKLAEISSLGLSLSYQNRLYLPT